MPREHSTKDGDPEMTGPRRLGYGVLGLLIGAMGLWIFPYQLEQGDVLKTVLGGGLAILGGLVVVRALLAHSLGAIEKVLDGLSGLGGS